MHVRKFEADTLEEALKNIKMDLGPDAIILKTITNKGIKSAFGKKRIEITAAISEKNYLKKAKVDNVLDEDMKTKFYNSNASHISSMLDKHSESETKSRGNHVTASYGKIGLNKTANQLNPTDNAAQSGLDNFLGSSKPLETSDDNTQFNPANVEPAQQIPRPNYEQTASTPPSPQIHSQQESYQDSRKLNDLEKKVFELSKALEQIERKEPHGIYPLSTTLRSLDINERYIQELIQKALFELTAEEVEDAETVFEFSLHKMMKTIKTQMPLFSSVDSNTDPVITVLLSETSSGQSSMMLKLGTLTNNSVLIQNINNSNAAMKNSDSNIRESKSFEFTEKMFGLKVVKVAGIAEIVSECRKAINDKKSVIIDYQTGKIDQDETKKFVDGLKRSFEKVEVLISISAIHSEIYNRKVVSLFKPVSNGIVISHLDLCLNFGAIFNIAEESPNLPFKFYGTGEVVPDDLEAATAERILAGIFQLN